MIDFASLRQAGIRELERLSGGQWTDFNTHDPGITILEQLCYALTDLGYRTSHDIPDLLAEGGADPYESFHLPAKILSCHPVTPADLRRIVLDVTGVQNAWVEPLLQQDAPTLYYDPKDKTLSLSSDPRYSEPVRLKGLYRVLIDPADDASSDLRARVAQRLHDSRGLCEDFEEITVLDRQMVKVEVTVEIGAVDDTSQLEREIIQKITDVISPPVPFKTLEEMLRKGLSLDAIFDGPRLEQGFLTDDVLEQATRRSAINTSDIVRAIRDIPDVRAVSRVLITAGEHTNAWSMQVASGKVAKLDRANSSIILRRGGKIVARTTGHELASASPHITASESGISQPSGRDRHLNQYTSVQHHFPAIYGVGERGLPDSASPARKARAKQLKAYLMFFDQIMANHLAQLAHVKDLFSHEDLKAQTYFAQTVDQPGPAPEAIRAPCDEEEPLMKSLVANREGSTATSIEVERKNRFLNHLLARFAETLDDHGTSSAAALAHRKQAFLRQYPRLGGARGTAFNYLEPASPINRPGLEQRIRLMLGLSRKERPIVVEHILLRPMEGDEKQDMPLLSASQNKDPYSLQLTFVFPSEEGRFVEDPAGRSNDFRALVEQTIREETPAHLTAYVRWMAADDWEVFQKTYQKWLDRRRGYWAEKLSVEI